MAEDKEKDIQKWLTACKKAGFALADPMAEDFKGHWAVMDMQQIKMIEAKTLEGRKLLGLLHVSGAEPKHLHPHYEDDSRRSSVFLIEQLQEALKMLYVWDNKVLIKGGHDTPIYLGTKDFNMWIAPNIAEDKYEYEEKEEPKEISDTGAVQDAPTN